MSENKFQMVQTQFTLRNFIAEYIKESLLSYDPESFFDAVRWQVLKFLRKKPENKITKMILFYTVEITDLLEREMSINSQMEFNHETTDKEELYDKMVEMILDQLCWMLPSRIEKLMIKKADPLDPSDLEGNNTPAAA